jgi:hypothetical protein
VGYTVVGHDKTIAGKQRSSRNALRHGLLAKQVILSNEAAANFNLLIAQHIRRFGPASGVEFGMIEEMAAAFRRLRRAWAIQTSLMHQGVEAAQPRDAVARIAIAFSTLADSPPNWPSCTAMKPASTVCISAP